MTAGQGANDPFAPLREKVHFRAVAGTDWILSLTGSTANVCPHSQRRIPPPSIIPLETFLAATRGQKSSRRGGDNDGQINDSRRLHLVFFPQNG